MPIAEITALALMAYAATQGGGAHGAVGEHPHERASTPEALTAGEVWAAAYGASGDVDWANKAVDVAWCESTWRTTAVGRAGEWGILQLHPVHLQRVRALGYTVDDMFQAVPNMVVAYDLWQDFGWSIWTCAR